MFSGVGFAAVPDGIPGRGGALSDGPMAPSEVCLGGKEGLVGDKGPLVILGRPDVGLVKGGGLANGSTDGFRNGMVGGSCPEGDKGGTPPVGRGGTPPPILRLLGRGLIDGGPCKLGFRGNDFWLPSEVPTPSSMLISVLFSSEEAILDNGGSWLLDILRVGGPTPAPVCRGGSTFGRSIPGRRPPTGPAVDGERGPEVRLAYMCSGP